MPQFAEPIRTPAPKAPDRHGPAGAAAKPARCLGAAAQLAAVRRTLAGGVPLQLKTGGTPGGTRAASEAAGPSAQTANRTGLPDRVKAGVEALSGLAMDDVRVHRDSAEPAKLGALAYTQGSDIHLGPGQEEHLPHEAWHVVQQKQGRVTATTQMKGVGVNDDAALEAEADRMGEMAEGGIETDMAGASQRTAGAPRIVQREIMHKKVELQPCPVADPCCHSEIVEAYVADPAKYVMRDTCSVLDNEIHLLDKNTYYVFGEEHGDPADIRWNNDVAGWDSVEKMVEEDLVTPGHPPIDVDKIPGLVGVRGTLPFDSVTAQVLTKLVLIQNRLNLICTTSDEKMATMSVAPAPAFSEAIAFLDEWYEKYYVDWMERIPDDPAIGASKAGPAAALPGKYGPQFDHLQASLHRLAVKTGLHTADAGMEPLPSAAKDYRDEVKTAGAFVTGMVKDLIALLSAPDKEAKQVEKLLSKKGDKSEAAIDATLAMRDRAMIANLAAVAPPVLVKTGEDHAEALSDRFGLDVYWLSPELPLAELTRKDKPPEPPKPPKQRKQ